MHDCKQNRDKANDQGLSTLHTETAKADVACKSRRSAHVRVVKVNCLSHAQTAVV